MSLLLQLLQLLSELSDDVLCVLFVLLMRQLVRVSRQQLLELHDTSLLLCRATCEVTAITLECRDAPLRVLVLRQLQLLLFEGGNFIFEFTRVLFESLTLLVQLVAVLIELLVLELQLGLHFARRQHSLEVVRASAQIIVLFVCHVNVEFELLNFVRQLRVDLLLVLDLLFLLHQAQLELLHLLEVPVLFAGISVIHFSL